MNDISRREALQQATTALLAGTAGILAAPEAAAQVSSVGKAEPTPTPTVLDPPRIFDPRLQFELQKIHAICPDEIVVLKVGSEHYPASQEDIDATAHEIGEYLRDHHSDTSVFVTHHAIDFQVHSTRPEDLVVVRVGNAERPATEQDLADVRAQVGELWRDRPAYMPTALVMASGHRASVLKPHPSGVGWSDEA